MTSNDQNLPWSLSSSLNYHPLMHVFKALLLFWCAEVPKQLHTWILSSLFVSKFDSVSPYSFHLCICDTFSAVFRLALLCNLFFFFYFTRTHQMSSIGLLHNDFFFKYLWRLSGRYPERRNILPLSSRCIRVSNTFLYAVLQSSDTCRLSLTSSVLL